MRHFICILPLGLFLADALRHQSAGLGMAAVQSPYLACCLMHFVHWGMRDANRHQSLKCINLARVKKYMF